MCLFPHPSMSSLLVGNLGYRLFSIKIRESWTRVNLLLGFCLGFDLKNTKPTAT